MINLQEMLLADTNGNYHYKGIVVKVYQNYANKTDWVFFVGYAGAQAKCWSPDTSKEITINQAMIDAVEWYLQDSSKQVEAQ